MWRYNGQSAPPEPLNSYVRTEEAFLVWARTAGREERDGKFQQLTHSLVVHF